MIISVETEKKIIFDKIQCIFLIKIKELAKEHKCIPHEHGQ